MNKIVHDVSWIVALEEERGLAKKVGLLWPAIITRILGSESDVVLADSTFPASSSSQPEEFAAEDGCFL